MLMKNAISRKEQYHYILFIYIIIVGHLFYLKYIFKIF